MQSLNMNNKQRICFIVYVIMFTFYPGELKKQQFFKYICLKKLLRESIFHTFTSP